MQSSKRHQKKPKMQKKRHVKKVKMAPWTDTQQGVREHNERVQKRNEYISKKIAEFEAKRMVEEEKRRLAAQASTSMTTDGFQKDDDSSTTK